MVSAVGWGRPFRSDERTSRVAWRQRLSRVLLVIATVWLLAWLVDGDVMFVEHIGAAIRFPYALDYGEGPLLDQTIRLAHFENIYRRSVDAPPYTISNYPPIFLLLQVPMVWIWGPALWYGRVINLISLLVAAISIALTIYTITGDKIAASVAGLILLPFSFIVHWSAFNRIDSLALGLSCAALWVIVRWGEGRQGLIGGAVLLTAAVYTRQSYALAAPLAAFVWLLRPRNGVWGWRKALSLAAWVAGMGLGVFLLLNLITWGGFYFNIVTANVNPFYWHTVRHYVQEIQKHLPVLLALGVLFMLAGPALAILGRRLGKRLVPETWWLVVPYLVGATLSAITIGKSGSNVNYLFELCAALSLLAGAWVAWPRKWPLLQMLAVLVLLPQAAGIVRWTRQERFNWIMGKIAERREIEQMAALVRQADGPVLADEYMGLIPLAGKRIYYQPFELKQLVLAGLWDESGLLQDLADQKFPLLLIYDPPWWESIKERWTPQQVIYIERYYQAEGRLANTVVYRPRSFSLRY